MSPPCKHKRSYTRFFLTLSVANLSEDKGLLHRAENGLEQKQWLMPGIWAVCYQNRDGEELRDDSSCLKAGHHPLGFLLPQSHVPSVTRYLDSPSECISVLLLLSTLFLSPWAFFLLLVSWLSPLGLSLKVVFQRSLL